MIRKEVVEYYFFYCPACKHEHTFTVKADKTQWNFNGNINNPSFSPSLLNKELDEEGKIKSICHLVITDNKIHYALDCTHELRGQIINIL